MNADIKKFVIESDGTPRLYQVDTKTVGKKISTKAVGTQRRVDVTDQVHSFFQNSSFLSCLFPFSLFLEGR